MCPVQPAKTKQLIRAAEEVFRAQAKAAGAGQSGRPDAAASGAAGGGYGSSATERRFSYSLDEESCTPKRPSYARDLRDEALVEAGYNPNLVESQVGWLGATKSQWHWDLRRFN